MVKSIPNRWFMGNDLNLTASCQTQRADLTLSGESVVNSTVLTEQLLSQKQFNINTKSKSAKNVYYYEFYSQPLDDGSYSQVIQIDLNIYFNKCLFSSEDNRLRCKTWVIVPEEQMILSGRLIKNTYFIYRTEVGIKMLQLDYATRTSTLFKEKFTEGRSTFTYQMIQNEDYIICSDYQNRVVKIWRLGKETKLYLQLADIYANQIDTSPLFSNLVFIGDDKQIKILNLNTGNFVNSIIGDEDSAISFDDMAFKICGHYLVALTSSGNRIEEYDISDPSNVVKIKDTWMVGTYANKNYKITSNTKIGFHFGCSNRLPLLVSDGSQTYGLITRLGSVQPNAIR